MKKKFSFLNQNGFSLMQAIIVAGIASALSVQLAQILQTTSRTQKRIEISASIDDDYNRIRNLFLDPRSCYATLNTAGYNDIVTSFNMTSLYRQKAEMTTSIDESNVINRRLFLDISDSAYIDASRSKGFRITEMFIKSCDIQRDPSVACPVPFVAPTDIGNNAITMSFYIKYLKESLIQKDGSGNPLIVGGKYKRRKGAIGSLEVLRAFPLRVYLNKDSKFMACYTSLRESAEITTAVNSAIAESCGFGMKVESVAGVNRCVPDLKTIVECEQENAGDPSTFMTAVTTTVDGSGKLEFDQTCKTFCNDGELGIWKGGSPNGVICNKCSSDDEVMVITSSGLMCSKLECSQTSSELKYLAGVDKDGDPICRTLVKNDDVKTEKCGVNGFRLVKAEDDSKGVEAECCSECQNVDKYCAGEKIGIPTTDCGVQCYGTYLPADYSYGDWGSCEKVSGKDACLKSRDLICNATIPGTSRTCCKVLDESKTTQEVCYNGNWVSPTCPTGEHSDTKTLEPTCSSDCCDPNLRPSAITCEARLYNGNNTEKNCFERGGSVTSHSGNKYCQFSGNCGSGFTKKYVQTAYTRRNGSSHAFCNYSFCEIEAKNYWHYGPTTCTYNNYSCYDTWNVKCSWCNGTTQMWATVTKSLCY